jgi:hypothetical protein
LKTIAAVIAIIALLGGFFSAYRFVDSRYALAAEFQKLEKRLDFKVANDQRISMQKEKREIEERNLGKPIEKWSQGDRDRYKQLNDDLIVTMDTLKSLKPGGI